MNLYVGEAWLKVLLHSQQGFSFLKLQHWPSSTIAIPQQGDKCINKTMLKLIAPSYSVILFCQVSDR